MKTITCSLIFILSAFAIVCNAQVNGVSCSGNTFWTITPVDSSINEFQLNGNTVTSMGVINTNAPGESLGFAWVPNNSNYSPTFYTSNENNAFYYEGAGWTKCPGNATNLNIVNCAGSANALYFLDNSGNMKIFRYANATFTSVYTSVSKCSVADIAADDGGNLWGFIGLDTLGSLYTDSIDVVNSSGHLIRQYPVWLNTANGYGCIMMNDTLYIGLGASNPFHPNTLLPIFIRNDSAITGTPIAMQTGPFTDMASCNAGNPLSVSTIKPVNQPVIIFPNPAGNSLSLKLPGNCALTIYNLLGQQVYNNIETMGSIDINVSAFPNGIYFLQTRTGNNIAEEKFEIQHL